MSLTVPYLSVVTVSDVGSLEPKGPLDLDSTEPGTPKKDSDPFAATNEAIFSSNEPQHLERLFLLP